jgi:hypothetical protein
MGEYRAKSLLSLMARTVKDSGSLSRPGLSCTTDVTPSASQLQAEVDLAGVAGVIVDNQP